MVVVFATSILIAITICTVLTIFIRHGLKVRRLEKLTKNIPGPLNLPLLGIAYKFTGSISQSCKIFFDLFETYPDIVKAWLGPHCIIGVSKPEYIEAILNSPNNEKMFIYEYVKSIFGDGLITAPVSTWRQHRKIISPTFNKKMLNTFVDSFNKSSTVLTEVMAKKCGNDVDMTRLLMNCTADILMETTMEYSFDAQKNEAFYSEKFERLSEIFMNKMSKIWYHYNFIYHRSNLYQQEKEIASYLEYIARQVIEKERKELESKASIVTAPIEENQFCSFIEVLIKKQMNKELTENEVVDEIKTIIVAGIDTLATSSCFLMTMLGMHPEIQDKVYKEVIEILGPDRQIELSDLSKFKYLECAIKESLRIFPTAPVVGRTITQDISLGEFIIPKDACLIFNLVALHRSEKYWPDPLQYNPDRFLAENSLKRHAYAWLPFSGGPRNCIGMNYAMMGLKIIMATIIRRFRLKTIHRTVEDIQLDLNITLKAANGYGLAYEVR